jgi:nitrite reductase/ring-hydroxylating ferredoxin subunit
MARYVVATVDEIPPGERKIVEVAGRSIGVFNVGGEFFALRNRCPHQGGPLCTGRLAGLLQPGLPGEYHYSRAGEMLRCPWHGWEFDVRTGQSWFDPTRLRVRSYEVSVAPGSALADDVAAPAPGLEKGPYVAETYPVSVEQQYIVIEVGT